MILLAQNLSRLHRLITACAVHFARHPPLDRQMLPGQRFPVCAGGKMILYTQRECLKENECAV